MASHNITTNLKGDLIPRKNKGKDLKGKPKDLDTAPDAASLSDEDDSHKREAALSSPIKGKTSRELNKES